MSAYAWEARVDAGLVTVLLAAAYLLALRFFPASRARRASFGGGILLLLLAFQTPLETIGLRYLLSAHLLQNVILAEWAPGLMVLGLPPALAAALGRVTAIRVVTHPLAALPLWLAAYFVWHVPAVYDLALRHPDSILHFEHASYFWTGAAMWWPIVHDAPRRWSSGVKAGYLFAAFLLASPLGLLLALVARPVYSFYVAAPKRLWGLSPLEDQQLGGLSMASEEAIVFFLAFAWCFFRFLEEEEPVKRRVTSGSQ